jgi:stage V sporulation protein AE
MKTIQLRRKNKMMFLKAFIIGGLICIIGQTLIDYTKLTPGKILVLFVIAGVVLGAVGVYEPLLKWAGCGASVPLTGFGALLAKGTREAIQKDGLLGVLTGPLSSGAAGIMAAVLSGLVVSFFTKSKTK